MEQQNQDFPKYDFIINIENNYLDEMLYNPFVKNVDYKISPTYLDTCSNKFANHINNKELFYERAEYIFNFFKDELNLKDYQAIAFLCVLYSESELNSNIGRSGGGHGIAQWTSIRKNRFHSFATNNLGLKKQLTIKQYYYTSHVKYISYELNNYYSEILKKLQKAKTFEEAVKIVLLGYENGDGKNLASIERINKVYKSQNLTYKKMYSDRISNKKYFKFLIEDEL